MVISVSPNTGPDVGLMPVKSRHSRSNAEAVSKQRSQQHSNEV